jgi:hypothetical protein
MEFNVRRKTTDGGLWAEFPEKYGILSREMKSHG